jgi:hypothetical protein
MNKKLLTLALLGIGIGVVGSARADLASDTTTPEAKHGTPVRRGGNPQDLLDAVKAGDALRVKTLLGQGADPVTEVESSLSEDSAISVALQAPAGQDKMLDLLLDHIVRVDKKALERLPPSTIEMILMGKGAPDLPRLRKLLAAGASAQGLSRQAVAAVFAAPERDLAVLLMKQGLFDKRGVAASYQGGNERFVDIAIATERTDLLPALLAQGANPSARAKGTDGREQFNSVEYAISQGKLEALKVLLTLGGVIDNTGVHPWGNALDLAVASFDPAILRQVSNNYARPLKQVCLPLPRHLEKVVLRASASYWTLLREHGFGQGQACAGIQQRLALHLAENEPLLETWPGQHLAERLPQLGEQRERFDAGTWAEIAKNRNGLAALLVKAGWEAPADAEQAAKPQKNKAADMALGPKLSGTYDLTGERGAAAELRLGADGKFQYSMSYDNVVESFQGTWMVWNQQVLFRDDPTAAPSGLTASTGAAAPGVPAGQLMVDVRSGGRSVPNLQIVVLGDAPQQATGYTMGSGWRIPFKGPVRMIAVSHPEVKQTRWMAYAVPAADALRGSYRLDYKVQDRPPMVFNYTFDVRDGALIWNREGSELLFKKR